jgi:hypothetical protein
VDASLVPSRQLIVWVPDGMTLSEENWRSRPTLLERSIHQTALQRALAAARSQGPNPTLAEPYKPFYLSVQQSDYCLALLKNAEPPADLSAARHQVDAWKKEAGYVRFRRGDAADKLAPSSPVAGADGAEVATPWIAPNGTSGVSLQSVETQADLQKQTRSELILLIFSSLLVMSYFRHFLAILRELLPEVILALVIVAIWFFGWGLLGAAILAFMICARLGWIAKILKSRWSPSPELAEPVSLSKQPPDAAAP